MKTAGIILLFTLILTGCDTAESPATPFPEGISLKTDNDSYNKGDSIVICLKNNTSSVLDIGFRCSYKNLEMFYQQKENDKWSENKWFGYMNLRCMTIQGKVNKYSQLEHTFSSEEFISSGTFRLLVPCYVPDIDSSIVVISNSFEIK
jgi:hypothetical protein